MIPKTIHYCWFGGNPLPEDAKKCIKSWKKHLPDYKIKEWNESNFDINSNLYVKQAYEAKKFAFVTDYVRLYALVTEGGIYMDTDVEVIKSYDSFLHHKAFSGFENNNFVPTGMMASEKGGKWATELLEEYNHRAFVNDDGTFDTTSNTVTITRYMLKVGLKQNNTFQDFPGLITIYPADYFCPKDHGTGLIRLTENSVCIHHFACSWLPHKVRFLHKCKVFAYQLFGERIMSKFLKR
jgi:putative glycosyltransferase